MLNFYLNHPIMSKINEINAINTINSYILEEWFNRYKIPIVCITTIIIIIIIIWYYTKSKNSKSKWWSKQTVKFRPQREPNTDGKVNKNPYHPEIAPPTGHYWDTKIETDELLKFINENYNQDTVYNQHYIDFLLQYPNTNFILLRDKKNNQLSATMLLRPIKIKIRRRTITCHYIDLLCVHPKLRKQGINEKMMDKLKNTLNNKQNDICIYKIDKKPLPYHPTAKLRNYILNLKKNTSFLPSPSFELKTYNGEQSITEQIVEEMNAENHNLQKILTPIEFKNYFTTNLNFRISFYDTQNPNQTQFCSIYFLNSTEGKVAEIVQFRGTSQFLDKILQKLRTLNVAYVNILQSAHLSTETLTEKGFRESEMTYLYMYNYQIRGELKPKETVFDEP